MTSNEQRHVKAVGQKLKDVKALLDAAVLSETAPMSQWLSGLIAMKEIVGNPHNDVNTVACLMAKDYLCRKLAMQDYDALAKAHGAKGLNIDEQTVESQHVIAEIKTAGAFGHKDIRQPQRDAILEDLHRLYTAKADHKYFFVVDADIFAIIKRKYSAHTPGIVLVLVSTGEEFAAS